MSDYADERAETERTEMFIRAYENEVEAWTAAARDVIAFHNCHCPGHVQLQALVDGDWDEMKP